MALRFVNLLSGYSKTDLFVKLLSHFGLRLLHPYLILLPKFIDTIIFGESENWYIIRFRACAFLWLCRSPLS
jgi:hypothetical protein